MGMLPEVITNRTGNIPICMSIKIIAVAKTIKIIPEYDLRGIVKNCVTDIINEFGVSSEEALVNVREFLKDLSEDQLVDMKDEVVDRFPFFAKPSARYLVSRLLCSVMSIRDDGTWEDAFDCFCLD